jgi:radical SAM protein with 4Fe4S-binding SPASM domain
MVNQISIPEGLVWNCPSRQQIVRVQSDIVSKADLHDRLAFQQKRFLIPRRTELILELPSPSMLRNFSNDRWCGPRIRVLISDDQIAEMHKRRSQFHVIRPTLVLNRCEGSLPRIIQFLASFNLPIEVNPTVFIDQDKKTLLDLADRLLFSPFVKTPVQPFFNLLLSSINSKGNFPLTLWDTCNESPGQNYFITNDGKITLSNRWSDKNHFFGDISDTIHSVRASRLFSELKSIKDRVFSENTKCYKCRVCSFCSGYLCALDSATDCTPFKSLYDFMSSHAQSLKESYTALPKQKKQDIFQAIEMPIQNK